MPAALPERHCTFTRVLSIAGSDSGGGAGMQADLKTFAALGCFGMSAITAVTAQNTLGVRAIHALPCEMLRAQIDAVAQDIGVDAVKIGMLHAADLVQASAEAIERYGWTHVVCDPVMVATSGAQLIEADAVQALVQRLFAHCSLITPNLDEAALLVGQKLHGLDDMRRAAAQLQRMGARAVLLKGGHMAGDLLSDVLLLPDGSEHIWSAPRIATANTHGTGCTLSAAIAAQLALGLDLHAAVLAARSYVRAALQAAACVRTGAGSGALNHAHAPQPMRLRRL